jgi:hypothetical protein
MRQLPTARRWLCVLAMISVSCGSALVASPASASPAGRAKYLERRLDVAREDLADAHARVLERLERRVTIKKERLEASTGCARADSEAHESACRSRVAVAVEAAEEEVEQARAGTLSRRVFAALERRIKRLEQELIAAKSASAGS